MIAATWAFVLILNLPSFGGEVKATITGADEASCNKLRAMVLKQVGGESNLNGVASVCVPTVPIK
jgi:hypothetical protein